jgi:hypothetical protein
MRGTSEPPKGSPRPLGRGGGQLNDLKLSKSFDELYAKYLLNDEYIKFLSRNKLFVIPGKETL